MSTLSQSYNDLGEPETESWSGGPLAGRSVSTSRDSFGRRQGVTASVAGERLEDGLWTYTWDAENRLISMQSQALVPAAGRRKLDFEYDPLGRRIGRVVSTGASGSWVVTSTTRWLYEGWNPVAELNGAGTLVREYVWGTDLSGGWQGAGGVGGLLWVLEAPAVANAAHYVAYDGNGNVMGLVNAADGTWSARYEYGPFGEVIRATGTMAAANPFRWSTKIQDEDSGLNYYGYRYYSAGVGRWLGRDPVRERGGINLYSFLANNATDAVDLLGFYQVDGHYYYVISALDMLGYPPTEAVEIGFYSQLPDELFDTTAFDFKQMPYYFEKVMGRDPALKDLGDYIHSLGLGDLGDILARRECLCRLLRGDEGEVKPWQAGFLLHALGDAHSHTWRRTDDPFGHRGMLSLSAVSASVGYPSITGHAGAGTWPDIIGNRPSLYVGFLDYLQGCLPRASSGGNDLEPLRQHILSTSMLLTSEGRQQRARSFAAGQLAKSQANLGDYQPELQDAFWLKDAGQYPERRPFTLPSVTEIKDWISWIKCSCVGK